MSAVLICLVDDSPDYRLLIQHVFTQYLPQWRLCLYESGANLLEALAGMDTKPDLIVLDQHMPGLNGHQTLQALRRQDAYRSIPVVMISADASASERHRAFELGASAFFVKPFDLEKLKDTLVEASQYARKSHE